VDAIDCGRHGVSISRTVVDLEAAAVPGRARPRRRLHPPKHPLELLFEYPKVAELLLDRQQVRVHHLPHARTSGPVRVTVEGGEEGPEVTQGQTERASATHEHESLDCVRLRDLADGQRHASSLPCCGQDRPSRDWKVKEDEHRGGRPPSSRSPSSAGRASVS
jgi:hypothetical protein